MNTDADWLTASTAVEATTLNRLHNRLAERAVSDGILDIGYRTVDSPIGQLLLAATSEGLVRIAFAGKDHEDVLQRLADTISPRILLAPGRLAAAAAQLEEYFAGRRRGFELPLDLRLAGGYRREVLDQLRVIGYGQTRSYADVARATGRPRAVRAVGTACATNPLPIVVPCHRVLRSDGSLGGYLGGLSAKRALLDLESRAP